MSGPGFVRTLHFRITASVVVLVVATGGLYYAWVNATGRNPYKSSEERAWFERAAAPELAALADRLAPVHQVRAAVDHLLATEGRRLARYDVELAVFDARGRRLSSSRPDSATGAFAHVDTSLLAAMSAAAWDFTSLPDPRITNPTSIVSSP